MASLGRTYWENQLKLDPIGAAQRIQSANDWWDSTEDNEIRYQLEHSGQTLHTDNVRTIPSDSKDIPDHWYNRPSNRSDHNLTSYTNNNPIFAVIPSIDEGNAAFKVWALNYGAANNPKLTPQDVTANPILLKWAIKIAGYFNNTPVGREAIKDNSFMLNMGDALSNYGKLTAGQAKGVLNWYIARVKYEQRSNAQAQTDTTKVDTNLDISTIPSGLYADPNPSDPSNRLKVKVNNFTDSKPNHRWHGWVFVNDGAEYGHQQKYGVQRPNQYYKGQVVSVLERIAADPIAAMAAYGHLTGTCGRCGRPLEDEESVARGIGPTCAAKIGY